MRRPTDENWGRKPTSILQAYFDCDGGAPKPLGVVSVSLFASITLLKGQHENLNARKIWRNRTKDPIR